MEVLTKVKEVQGGNKMKGKCVVLLSGGMDSTALVYYMLNLGLDVYPIGFYYGQKHQKELDVAMRTCEKLGLEYKLVDTGLDEIAPSALTRTNIEIPNGHYKAKSMKLTVVPNRNMVFLALATSYALGIDANQVAYAAHSGDHAIYPDCRPEFITAMAEAIKLCDDKEVFLNCPFMLFDKAEILRTGFRLGVDYSLTWSCYKGNDKPCLRCGTCTERTEAFQEVGIKDPLEYKEV